MKTSELSGAALDYAVRILVEKVDIGQPEGVPLVREFLLMRECGDTFLMPSQYWESGGPIIERELLEITPRFRSAQLHIPDGEWRWYAYVLGPNNIDENFEQNGPTPLIAAMRCYVASKLGDEVDIPKELL